MESRRDFIKKASLLTANFGFLSVMPESIRKALEINPELGSTYLEAEHVVFLMQENRSFDHVFGSLKGVRGFNDPRAISLPNTNPVWLQSNKKGDTYVPFRLNINDTKATWMSYLPHSWENQVGARNNGKYDNWLETKKSGNKAYADMPLTMGYYNRQDIPFYYALADAFTVCDHNFCSSLTGTSPNRSFFWTGKIKETQNEQSKAHVSNGDIDGSERLSWSTFPERLSAHNVDWKIYQNELSVGVGFEGEEEGWLANFTDNSLEFFKQFHVKRHPKHLDFLKNHKGKLELQLKENPDPKLEKELNKISEELLFLQENTFDSLTKEQQELHERAFVTNKNDPNYHDLETITYDDNGVERSVKIPKGDVLHQFRSDVDSGKLPTVSWLVAPSNFSDHPGSPWYGAWYLSEAMDILTKNPEVWKKTIFVLTYDENDGYFDHVPPFVAPNPKDSSTGIVSKSLDISAEFVHKYQSKTESPIGLGYRVPMVIVSPWSRGGYVNSQVFDHTSSIQFLEHFLSHKTGGKIVEDNISSWRRSLCGDLTSVFRPFHGEKIYIPKKIEKAPFLESIHKVKFAKLPDGFVKLDQEAVDLIRKYPGQSQLLPKQEAGIKPANSIPYEIYAHGGLSVSNFKIGFTAGNAIFAMASSGVGFNVYGGGKNWAFTVEAGDTIDYLWPLSSFVNQHYDLKVHSVNGFYRRFTGNENDPKVTISLFYKSNNEFRLKSIGNVFLHIKRFDNAERYEFKLADNSYGMASQTVVLEKNEKELILPLNLKKSHSWYDFTLKAEKYPDFSQQFAGHAEQLQESFTDPLMGGYR